MIKVAFLGTPSIGASALQSLINDERIEVVVVVTTEDKAVGRSHSTLKPSPVAELADKNGLDIIKTNSINNDVDKLKEYSFDYMLTCAFGQFLSDEVLSLPKKKALNIHGSLLPEGRGGAPLHWAIINGKEKTGISIMEMVSKMDAGDYYSQFEIPISHTDTVDDLFENMSNLILEKSAQGVVEVEEGATANVQDESKVTFWMNVKKEDARIDFSKTDLQVHNQIRGLTSKPGAWTTIDGKVVKIHKAEIYSDTSLPGEPGEILYVLDEGLMVKTGKGEILIKELTVEGSKRKTISINDIIYFANKKFE